MKQVIEELYLFVLRNINNEIALEALAQKYHYDKSYISREFKNYTGYTLVDFINRVRVLNTIDPLILTNDKIVKIAINNGFNSQEYYTESFRKNIGTSPLQFRKEYQNIQQEESRIVLERKQEELKRLINERRRLTSVHTKPKVLKRLPK